VRQINTEAIEKYNFFPLVGLEKYENKPYVKWSNSDNWITNIEQLKQLENKTGAGLLTGEKSGIMVIDLDVDHVDGVNGINNFNELWQEIPNTLIIESPNNGWHIYYKYKKGLKNRSNYFAGIDLRTDGGYIVAPGSKRKKKNGNMGEYKVIIDLPIAEIPEELFQLFKDQDEKQKIKKTHSGKTGQVKSGQAIDNKEFKTGERNDKLFKAGVRKFSKSIERDLETIFAYIISLNEEKCKPPIEDERELKSISESIYSFFQDRVYDQNDKVIPILLVNNLMAQRPLFIRGNFVFIYDDEKGFYELVKENEIHKTYFANCKDVSDLTPRKAKNFSELLMMVARDDVQKYPEKDFINCLDGVLNWKTGDFFKHDSKFRLTTQIHANCLSSTKTDFQTSYFKKFLDGILDKETQKMLQESMGLMLSPHAQEVQSSFCFLGNGSNGKSKLMDIMAHLIGQENISSLGFSKFSGEFDLASLEGKSLNLVYDDDLSEANGKIGAAFKSVVCGEPVNVNKKNKDHQPMQFNITHFFGLNVMPSVREKSHGIFRRISILPFKKTFGSEEDVAAGKADCVRDSNITKEIMENELDLIFRWSVEGLKRLYFKDFNLTISEASKQEMEDYKRDSDSAYQFLQEGIESAPGYRICVSDVICAYNFFCDSNGIKPMDGRNFGKRLKALGVQQKRTNTARFYLDVKIRGSQDTSKPYIDSFTLLEGGSQ
jgi:P4 family phage/plasmid primase-like protien